MDKSKKGTQKTVKDPKKQAILVVLVLLLLVGSFFISVKISEKWINDSKSFEYGRYVVFKTKIGGVDFYALPIKLVDHELFWLKLRGDPREIESVESNIEEGIFGGTNKVWLTTNPSYDANAVIAGAEIAKFTQGIGISTSAAFVVSGYNETLQKNCEDSNIGEKVVDLRLGNQTRVYSEGYCIIVEGKDDEEIIDAADKFVYEWLDRFTLEEVELE
ncbi:hypothetical protein ACFLZZ_03035 [Nanoarchaeota archaeon]